MPGCDGRRASRGAKGAPADDAPRLDSIFRAELLLLIPHTLQPLRLLLLQLPYMPPVLFPHTQQFAVVSLKPAGPAAGSPTGAAAPAPAAFSKVPKCIEIARLPRAFALTSSHRCVSQVALRSITERSPTALRKGIGADAPATGAAPAFAAVALKSAGAGATGGAPEDKPPAYANLSLKKTGVHGSPSAASAGTKADGGAPAFANVALKSTGIAAAAPTTAGGSPVPAALPASYNASAVHPHDVLKASTPSDIDPANKERHLSPADFSNVFGMDLAAFNALPKWKRDAKKKDAGLF